MIQRRALESCETAPKVDREHDLCTVRLPWQIASRTEYVPIIFTHSALYCCKTEEGEKRAKHEHGIFTCARIKET